MNRVLMAVAVCILTFASTGCRFFRGAISQVSEVSVQTRQDIRTSDGRTITDVPLPHTNVSGGWVRDDFTFCPPQCPAGTFLSYGGVTNEFGRVGPFVSQRYNAFWDVHAFCFNRFVQTINNLFMDRFELVRHRCGLSLINVPFSSTRFEIAGSSPSTITLGGEGLSAQNGMPILYVYDRWENMINRIAANQVSPDGTWAAFPFPRRQNGTPLASDIYGMVIANWVTAPQTYCEPMWDEWGNYMGDYCWEVPGELRTAGSNYIGIGGPTTLTTPFGVDATAADVQGMECWSDPYGEPYPLEDPYDGTGRQTCTTWSYTSHDPLVTLNTVNQLSYRGSVLGVGSSPTAVKAYWTDTHTNNWGDASYYYEETITEPSRALVVNSASSSVSVVDLIGWRVITTIPVGTRPSAVLIAPDESKAYVANFDSSTLTEVNLFTNTVTRTASVGYRPTALTLDPSGSAIWAGGQGSLSKVDLASFSTVATYTVNGTITSMGASNAQNSIVYTAMANGSAPNSTYGAAISYPSSIYSVRKLRLADMSTTISSSVGSGSTYEYSAMSSSLPLPSLLAGGTKVSVNYGNGISVSATPRVSWSRKFRQGLR